MKLSKVIPVLAILIAIAVLAATIHLHMTTPENEPTSTFVPPEPEVSEPASAWPTGVTIVTPIA